jgi:truncated hemoglobin YjbI
MRQLRGDFDRWRQQLEGGNSATNEFAELTADVKKCVKEIRVNLNLLSETIEIVNRDRARFSAIDDAELESRERFVRDAKSFVQGVQETLQSDRTKRKQASDKARVKETLSGMEREQQRSADEFLDSRRQQHLMVEREQDAVLEGMSETLARLGEIAKDIDTEVKEQNETIEDVTSEVDTANDRFGRVQKKIENLLGTSDRWKLCCIFWLFILMIILFALVIYT